MRETGKWLGLLEGHSSLEGARVGEWRGELVWTPGRARGGTRGLVMILQKQVAASLLRKKCARGEGTIGARGKESILSIHDPTHSQGLLGRPPP